MSKQTYTFTIEVDHEQGSFLEAVGVSSEEIAEVLMALLKENAKRQGDGEHCSFTQDLFTLLPTLSENSAGIIAFFALSGYHDLREAFLAVLGKVVDGE